MVMFVSRGDNRHMITPPLYDHALLVGFSAYSRFLKQKKQISKFPDPM